MTRVLLTGATGFIGQHVLRALAGGGLDVHAVSSRALPRGDDGTTWHQADLMDAGQIERLMQAVRPDGLIHLAWFTTPPEYWRSPENLRWLAASLQLADAFERHGGRRLVGVGTCAEYDWRFGSCTERTTPLAPETLYGTTKAALGSVLESFGQATGLSVAWARLFFLLGPHEHPSRLVPSLVQDIRAGRTARCLNGRLIRDFLHVADAASAIVALYHSAVTGPVNIASGEPTAIGSVAAAVASRLGRPDLLAIEPGSAAPELLVGSMHRLRDEVGWTPERNTDAAIAATVDWWAAHAEAKPQA